MRTCKRCKETKFGIFMYSEECGGLYTQVFDICKKCANSIKSEAVRQYCSQKESSLQSNQ